MALKADMIYLYNSNYDFEDTRGGCIFAQLDPAFYLANRAGFIDVNLKLEKLCRKFQKAKSTYWEDSKCKGYTFGFLREDGAEFAIRILPNNHLDVIAYWKDLLPIKGDSIAIFDYEIQEYTNFVRWLEDEI